VRLFSEYLLFFQRTDGGNPPKTAAAWLFCSSVPAKKSFDPSGGKVWLIASRIQVLEQFA
jgi:hypothetical protein